MVCNFITLLERSLGDQLDDRSKNCMKYIMEGADRMRRKSECRIDSYERGRSLHHLMCCPARSIEKERMPEMKATAWINSKPLTMKDFKEKVVLLYFFSFDDKYSSTTISYLNFLSSKMAGKGLKVVGVHSPSLEREKDLAYLSAKVKALGISFPVAVDNEQAIWKAFRNQFFEEFQFVDAKGWIRHTRTGEGIEEEVEMAVVHLLNEAGFEVDLGPEIDGACLEGDWMIENDCAELDGPSGTIALRYIGRSLDLVLSSCKRTKVEFKMDGRPLDESIAGKDVLLEKGRSYLEVGEETRLQVVREEGRVMHELEIKVRVKGFRLIGFCVDDAE